MSDNKITKIPVTPRQLAKSLEKLIFIPLATKADGNCSLLLDVRYCSETQAPLINLDIRQASGITLTIPAAVTSGINNKVAYTDYDKMKYSLALRKGATPTLLAIRPNIMAEQEEESAYMVLVFRECLKALIFRSDDLQIRYGLKYDPLKDSRLSVVLTETIEATAKWWYASEPKGDFEGDKVPGEVIRAKAKIFLMPSKKRSREAYKPISAEEYNALTPEQQYVEDAKRLGWYARVPSYFDRMGKQITSGVCPDGKPYKAYDPTVSILGTNDDVLVRVEIDTLKVVGKKHNAYPSIHLSLIWNDIKIVYKGSRGGGRVSSNPIDTSTYPAAEDEVVPPPIE